MTETNVYPRLEQNNEPMLEVHHLVKWFPIGGVLKPRLVHAVNDVSFSIHRGHVVALVGESGSGKSTVARLIIRLIQPTQGEIFLDGVDVLKSEPRKASLDFRRRVQMIFQDPFASLSPNHSIGYQLERPLITKRLWKTWGEGPRVLATAGLNPR
jgi:peptide/nickel transport system ATP-binding protein